MPFMTIEGLAGPRRRKRACKFGVSKTTGKCLKSARKHSSLSGSRRRRKRR